MPRMIYDSYVNIRFFSDSVFERVREGKKKEEKEEEKASK